MRTILAFFVAVFLGARAASAGERIPFDSDWRFALGDRPGAESPDFVDSDWRAIRVPHDWSIESAPDPAAPASNPGGYYATGIGWYRRTFFAPAEWRSRIVRVAFDGVYMNASVWINGRLLGTHPYGYTPFTFDLTPFLRAAAPNVIAVRVDNSHQPSSRWYTGSGIYRHVTLEVLDPVHLEASGLVAATSSESEAEAFLLVEAPVRNETGLPQRPQVEVVVSDPHGTPVVTQQLNSPGDIPAGATGVFRSTVVLGHPRLWSPDSPALYRLTARVISRAGVIDETSLRFGVRTVHVSAQRGLEINGRSVKLNGGSVHHDNGPLGSAAFDRAEERRVELLKSAGFNAVRTAHNPPSPAFLDACDRLGVTVIDEAFDTWVGGWISRQNRVDFQQWWQRDLEAMVTRDRNHPSVVMWSIGNEVYERGAPEGARIARMLADRIHDLDRSRPITAGINGMGKAGRWEQTDPLFAELDVAGYNYELARAPADHARLPARAIVATESFQKAAFEGWAAVRDQPYVVGDFVWSALDYLGESGIGRVFPPGQPAVPHWQVPQFPWHGAACGDIDLTGWRRPASHYRAVVWGRGETLYMAATQPAPDGGAWSLSKWAMLPALPSWTWPGAEGKPIHVEVYCRRPEVSLYLNGRLVGRKATGPAEEFKAAFEVPYEPGTLRAVTGTIWNREAFEIPTAGPPARLRLSADRTVIAGDGEDLSFVVVEVVDAQGRLRPDAENEVRCAISGPGEVAGFGNADMTDLESYAANPHKTYQGRALVIIRSQPGSGWIVLSLSSPGLEPATARIEVRNSGPRP
jgi:beta-galactosidase